MDAFAYISLFCQEHSNDEIVSIFTREGSVDGFSRACIVVKRNHLYIVYFYSELSEHAFTYGFDTLKEAVSCVSTLLIY